MLILAVIFAGWAVTLMVAVGTTTPLHVVLYRSVPGMLSGMQAGLSRYVGPYPWDYVIQPLLELPAWIPPLCVAGLLVVAHGIIQRRAW